MIMPGLLQVSAGAGGGSLLGVGKAQNFFPPFSFAKNVARTDKLLGVQRNPWQHFNTISHPITFLVLPHVYILLPSDGQDGK